VDKNTADLRPWQDHPQCLGMALNTVSTFSLQQLWDMDVCDLDGTTYLMHQNQIYVASRPSVTTGDRIGSSNYADDNAITNGCTSADSAAAQELVQNTENSTDALTVGLALVGVQTNLTKSYVSCSPRLKRLLGDLPTIRVHGISKTGTLIYKTLVTVKNPGTLSAPDSKASGCIAYLGPIMSAGGSVGPLGVTYWEPTEQKILQKARGFAAVCATTNPDLPTVRIAAGALLYQTNISWHAYRLHDAVNSFGEPWLMLCYAPLGYPLPSWRTALRTH